MAVRRSAARLATVCALLGGLMAVGAAPALAEDDSVRVRSASTFATGGSPGAVSIEVRKRSDGCVLLRTSLTLRLDGVTADQVNVQVAAGGQWWPVPVSGGNGAVSTARTSPVKPSLCEGKSITVKYRVTFLPGSPAGRLTVVGEATNARDRSLGRGADSSRVVAGRNAAPITAPTPTVTASEVATEPPTTADSAPTLAAVGQAAGPAADGGDDGGGGSLVMFFGIAMVGVGIALIVLLVRRFRADKEPSDAFQQPPGGLPLPHGAGGTTYRSTSGHPGAPPPPAGGYPGSSPRVGGYPGSPPTAGGYPGSPPPSGGGDSTQIMPRLPG